MNAFAVLAYGDDGRPLMSHAAVICAMGKRPATGCSPTTT